jgi:hypothetical protein
MTNVRKETSEIQLQGSAPSPKAEPSASNYGLIGSNAAALVLLAQLMAQYGNDLTKLNSEMQANMAKVLGGIGAENQKGLLQMVYDATVDQGVQAANSLSAQLTGAIVGLAASGASVIGLTAGTVYQGIKTSALNKNVLKLQEDLKDVNPFVQNSTLVSGQKLAPLPKNPVEQAMVDKTIAERGKNYNVIEHQDAIQKVSRQEYKELMDSTRKEVEANQMEIAKLVAPFTQNANAYSQLGSAAGQTASTKMQQEPEIDKAKDQAEASILETVQRQTGQSIDSFQRTAMDSHADANKAANDLAAALQGQGRA